MKELNARIYERDGGHCILCDRYVDRDAKFHHEPPGSYRSDEIEKGVLLCTECHDKRHNSKYAEEYRQLIVLYLRRFYGEKGAKRE